jgi:prepilin-type processing-associated H-X9-DG protein
MNVGLQSKTIYEVVFHPQNSNVAYCGGHQSGLYKTENRGEKWELIDNELKGKSIKSIVIHPKKPEIIFVGCLEGGLYKSTDSGKSFQCIGECEGRVWKILLMP